MKIGIGLPTAIPSTDGSLWVPWAQKAEAFGFSSLSTIGRTVFDSHEELIVLAAAAAVTHKIRLLTTVMIGPPRETVLLAKQAATLNNLSNGRLTLGLGIGWRSDDFEVVGMGDQWARRGELLEAQIAKLREVWKGQQIGPDPKSLPEILVGGAAPAALRRAGKLADAFIAGPFPLDQVREHYRLVDEAAPANRKPRRVCARYFALGDDVTQELEANVRAYYIAGGEDFVKGTLQGVLRTPAQVEAAIRDAREVGADEFCLWPQIARLHQVERLAETVFAKK
jgi:alkanesulfonate monooxygenase SsuD/methylene tetrahydromethanopterin reductase-like flavin-dependent oxidoreductase (luciferase family)